MRDSLLAIGVLARLAASEDQEARKDPSRWFWPVVAVVAIGGAIATGALTDFEGLGPGAAFAGMALLAGGAIWFGLCFVGWLRRFRPPDLRYRARVTKAFAVCTMLAGSLALLAALPTMALTRHRQKAYYGLTTAELRNEIRLYYGKDWPESFRGPEAEVFEVRSGASQPSRSTPSGR